MYLATNILKAAITIVWLTFLQFFFIFAGFFVVPIGVLFSKTDESTRKNFTYYNTNYTWVYEDLPDIFLFWKNIEDGLRGDVRGWWDANSPFGPSDYYLSKVWWSAWRNPANFFKRFILGLDIREYTFIKIAGQDKVRDDFENTGWQFLKAFHKKENKDRYMFYGVFRYFKSNYALVIQLGHKIKLSHNTETYENEVDYSKGFTFEINPFKNIS